MSDGLWISSDQFLSFGELDPKSLDKQALLQELYATGMFGFDPLSWLGLLPDPDPVLRKTGEGMSVLRDLTADPKVISSIQNRKLGTLLKQEFSYQAGHAAGEAAAPAARTITAALQQDLEHVDLFALFSSVLDAPYYGYTPVEIIWRAEGGRYRIADLKARPPEWFDFDSRHQLVYKGDNKPAVEGKIVCARHFPDATNPYGIRLLSRCLWPVAIKKGGIKWWAMLCEKFGMPHLLGKAPAGAGEPERQAIASMLQRMVQDAIAVVSSGTEVEPLNLELKGGSLHPELVRYQDTAIALVLMGQTLTAEVGERGSYAAGKVHEDVLDKYTNADEKLLVTFMEDLAWTYTQVNDASALSPTFSFIEPEDYAAQAELDTKLHGVGVRFTKVHFTRRYDLAEDEIELETSIQGNPQTGPGKNPGAGSELAAPGDGEFTPEQQAIEDLVEEIRADAAGALAGNEQLLVEAITGSDSYEEAFEKILELYPKLETTRLEELLERALFAAGAFGRSTAGTEAS